MKRPTMEEIYKEGKRASSAIHTIRKLNDSKMSMEFIELSERIFSKKFKSEQVNYINHLQHIAKVITYLETVFLPNFNEEFNLASLSPEVQLLFFKSINSAYIEFKKIYAL